MKNQIKQANKSTKAEADEEDKQDNSSEHSSPPPRKNYKKVSLDKR